MAKKPVKRGTNQNAAAGKKAAASNKPVVAELDDDAAAKAAKAEAEKQAKAKAKAEAAAKRDKALDEDFKAISEVATKLRNAEVKSAEIIRNSYISIGKLLIQAQDHCRSPNTGKVATKVFNNKLTQHKLDDVIGDRNVRSNAMWMARQSPELFALIPIDGKKPKTHPTTIKLWYNQTAAELFEKADSLGIDAPDVDAKTAENADEEQKAKAKETTPTVIDALKKTAEKNATDKRLLDFAMACDPTELGIQYANWKPRAAVVTFAELSVADAAAKLIDVLKKHPSAQEVLDLMVKMVAEGAFTETAEDESGDEAKADEADEDNSEVDDGDNADEEADAFAEDEAEAEPEAEPEDEDEFAEFKD